MKPLDYLVVEKDKGGKMTENIILSNYTGKEVDKDVSNVSKKVGKLVDDDVTEKVYKTVLSK